MSAHWAMPDFDAMMPARGGDFNLNLARSDWCPMYIEVLHVKGVIVSQQEHDVSAKWLIGMHAHQLDTFYATRSGLKSVPNGNVQTCHM